MCSLGVPSSGPLIDGYHMVFKIAVFWRFKTIDHVRLDQKVLLRSIVGQCGGVGEYHPEKLIIWKLKPHQLGT